MNDEDIKILEILKETLIKDKFIIPKEPKKRCEAIENLINRNKELEEENENLISDNLEYQRTQDIFDKRTYRKKYLEERRKEEPNLLYPDADEIYERYYNQKTAIENLINRNKELEEIEQEHKKENGELRKRNKELEKIITRKMNNNKKLAYKYLRERYKNSQLELDEKEQEVAEAYRNMINITGSDEWIVCNPSIMWSKYFVSRDKIKEKIKELDELIKEAKDELGTASKEFTIYVYQKNILKQLLEEK